MRSILGPALLAGTLLVAGCGSSAVVPDSALGRAQRGFTSIPGLTKVAESHGFSICAGYKGTSLPAYCRPGGGLHSTRGFQQVWKPKPPSATAPSQVVLEVFRTQGAATAEHFMPIYAQTEGYTGLRAAAINGGIAGTVDSLANDGHAEFRFAWTSGSSMVVVNVIGPKLTLGQARDIASRASPS